MNAKVKTNLLGFEFPYILLVFEGDGILEYSYLDQQHNKIQISKGEIYYILPYT